MNQPASRPGRRKAFDPDTALEAAMETFWAKGFDGSSLDDLTRAMNINRPSLYATFGSKRGLFDQALERYCETIGSDPLRAFLDAPDVETAVRRYLTVSADLQTREGKAQGCMSAHCATVIGEPDDAQLEMMRGHVDEAEATIAARFEAEKQAGKLPPDFDSAGRAAVLLDFMQAQAMRARSGAGRCAIVGAIESRVDRVLAT